MATMPERIKELRKEHGYTQEDLAKKLHLNAKSSIANYESGSNSPSDEIKLKLCGIFNCSMDYLMGETNYKNLDIAIKNIFIHTYKRVRDLREDNDLTQAEMAKFLHITRPQYSLYESGKREFPSDLLVMIAKRFDCTLDYLLGLSNIQNPKYTNDNCLKINIDMTKYTAPTKDQQNKIKAFAEFILKDNKKR